MAHTPNRSRVILGGFARWSGDQYRRIRHKWALFPERRMGPGDGRTLGKTKQSSPPGAIRDVQMSGGFPAGDRCRSGYTRAIRPRYGSGPNYRDPRWTGRFGRSPCFLSPNLGNYPLGLFPHAVAPNLDCC